MSGNRDGEWICPNEDCQNVNFSYRTKCNRCRQDRNNVTVDLNQQKVVGVKSIGKDAAQRSNGLFKENDWECPKCSNINWAKRNYCNQCNAPRFRSAEARTGLGGGFKENDDVDYIVRGNDNEEFDEYGRRRGKINPTDHSIVVEASANSDDDDDETNNADNKVDIDSDTDNITSESRSNSSVSESETSSINESEGDDDDDDDANLSKYNFDSDSSENGDTTDNSDECSEDNSKHSKLKRYAPSSPSNDSDGNLSNTHHKKSKLD